MKHIRTLLTAAVLTLALLLPLLGTAETAAEKTYGVCLADQVRVRKQPKTSANMWFYIDKGHVAEILDVVADGNGDPTWYKVSTGHPQPNGRTYIGYISADFFRPMTAQETADYLAGLGVTVPTATPTAAATAAPGTAVTGMKGTITAEGVALRAEATNEAEALLKFSEGAEVEILTVPDQIGTKYWYSVRYQGQVGYVQSNYVRVTATGGDASTLTPAVTATATPPTTATGSITADGVNFRIGPGLQYGTMGKLNHDTVVELLSIPDTIDADHWYHVRYNGQTGYIQAPYIRVLTLSADALPEAGLYGYAQLTQTSANLRLTPGGTTAVQWTGKGSRLRITGDAVQKGSFYWYPVYYEAAAAIYYVRGDLIEVVERTGGSAATATPAPESEYGYVITTVSGVNLRIKPAGESVGMIPRNTILACAGKAVSPQESGTSYTWYYVRYEGMYGYLRGDCVRVCTATGGDVAATPTPEPEATPAVTTIGYIKLIKTGVNLRVKPQGNSQVQLPRGLILPVVGEVIPAGQYGKYCWYPVRTADGMTGYIRGDCAQWCNEAGGEAEATPTPTPTPTADTELTGAVGKLRKSSNFRKGPGTSYGVITVIKVDTVVTVLSIPENKVSGWYKIAYNGSVGYVYASLLELLTDGTSATATPTVAPTATPAPGVVMSSYVQVTANGVNLRTSYSTDADSRYQVNRGEVMLYTGYKDQGSVRWYRVVYHDIELWIHGGYVQVLSSAEYKAWLAANPDAVPDVTENLGYLKLVKDKVYIRSAANGAIVIDQLAKGTVIRYYSEKIEVGSHSWYHVLTPNGWFGYIRSDTVEVCDQYGNDLPESTPTVGGSTSSAPSSQQETSYSRLSLGSTGEKVSNLVAELINQGYYTGTQTSTYTSAVQAAVKAFQAVKGLTVDGIAGSETQHALFGTMPIGSGDTTNLDFAIYPVEKIDWYTGGIQQLIPRGSNFKVYDVKTGIVWWAHRWAGSDHADIETLTAADSARLCEIYGVKNLQEIVDKNMWQRRPCLVTIGTRTFACSLDGMQHGTDTIANNGMDGQICLHFTNSKGHASGAVSTSHKEAIEYAYNNCPAGQK